MRGFAVSALLIAGWSAPAAPAMAWEGQGHELVGAIADAVLADSKAGVQARQILGYGLHSAAKWPDCVRGVHKGPSGFHYQAGNADCTEFENPAEIARMIDYVRRNWSNCQTPPPSGCHTEYHFADVAVQRSAYSRSYFGTSNDDIVSALGSAILVLQGKPALPPFSIKDKKEALILIAHFVGDLHQPLHVGGVYLRQNGSLMDPDTPPHQNPKTIEDNDATRGGNVILIQGGSNLHSMWDDIPNGWGRVSTPDLLAKAKAVPPTHVQIDMLPPFWAGESIRISHDAFKGLTFGARNDEGKWSAKADDPASYKAKLETIQRQQIVKGGARLAELLKEIWPDQ